MQAEQIRNQIKAWAKELGFQACGISRPQLGAEQEQRLQQWLDAGYHGEMQYMAEHGMLRARPAELHPGALSVISVRLDYLPKAAAFATNLADPSQAYISRYALGRDYHKLMRNRLKQLGKNAIFEVSMSDGKTMQVIVKDIQQAALKNQIQNVALQALTKGQKLTILGNSFQPQKRWLPCLEERNFQLRNAGQRRRLPCEG